jgi:zinc finger protein
VPSSDEPPPMNAVTLDAPCPVCGTEGLRMRSMGLDLPYFGDALQTTVLCEACGFRHGDVLLMHQGPPTRHRLRVRGSSDLSARVVRSSSSTVRVPEIGAMMEPGMGSEAFISNAEGVLHRFRDILGFLARHADTDARKEAARRSLRTLERMIEGSEPFTLVLEDPSGNSAILHESTEVRTLSEREARRLKADVFTMELRPGGRRAPASR